MKACAKHQKEPVKGHCECPGCEVENLRIECQTLQHGLRLANDRLADELARRAVPAQAKVVAWMTEDGRVASDETKRTAMAKQSAVNFNIPLCRADVPAQASAPAADAYRDCCDTPSLCSAVRRCTAKDSAQSPSQGEMDAGPAAALVKGRSVYEWYASYCEVSEKLKAADGCIERYKKLVEARPAAASGEAVRQNMELVIARLTDIVDAAETADCDLMESSAKDALPCAKAVLASLATAPSQPEASADKLALTDAVRAVIRDINSDSGEGWCAADEEHYWNAIIATLKGQQ